MTASRRRTTWFRGLRACNSRHRDVRRLKRKYQPAVHGYRIWKTTWLLIDYLSRHPCPTHLTIMDLGCGWGLAGLYCAKTLKARVLSADVDWDVLPYLHLHQRINRIETEFVNEGFEDLRESHFAGVDMLIGADICFWPQLVDVLKAMLQRAVDAGVTRMALADPGRPTFNELGDFCEREFNGQQFYWRTSHPYIIQGQIIDVGSQARRSRLQPSSSFSA